MTDTNFLAEEGEGSSAENFNQEDVIPMVIPAVVDAEATVVAVPRKRRSAPKKIKNGFQSLQKRTPILQVEYKVRRSKKKIVLARVWKKVQLIITR